LSKRYAVVSVGTNSTRMLLADVAFDVPRIEATASIGTRLGEGMGPSDALGAEPMRRTIDALAQLQRRVRGHYVRLFAVATSALRRATNGDEFLARAQEVLGIPIRVLSGDEEATASYRGAISALGTLRGERVGVVDTGGGSTEYAIGTDVAPERVLSCEIGAVRLTEALPQMAGRDGAVDEETIERARTLAREALKPMTECEPVERVAMVGGSATTAAAIMRGRRGVLPAFRLTRDDLQGLLARVCAMPLEERKRLPGLKPQRADILPAGIVVLDAALESVGLAESVATTSDLLLGILLQHRDAAPAAGDGSLARAASIPPRNLS
jgi:exopolyphosphatase / guanosine-5'-triphosphate,3'-diphosphate pyrophosphatase